MSRDLIIQAIYIASCAVFIIGLKMLGKADRARRGNMLSSVGMLLAVVATLLYTNVVSFEWIIVGAVIGALFGAVAAYRVPMTAMPEMVGLFNGFGGLASLLVGWSDFHRNPDGSMFALIATVLTILIGGVTFSGSMVAYLKLAEKMSGRPILFGGQQVVNSLLLLLALAASVIVCAYPPLAYPAILALIVISLILGILAVIPIGGADMPVVISLLNSYSGLAACAAGFILLNTCLIVAGCLVGASGIILTQIMCKAMNRSLANVLFSGFGSAAGTTSAASGAKGEAKALSVQDAYLVLEAARSVLIVPGYGMAVAQAQHAVRELGELLTANGAEVKYAIHPVAGRMPGHMNVLLAEANVPYEQLAEPQDVNPVMETMDVAIVIGANDVVNPAAREDKGSPIYGMPIINVDQAKSVFILKRSMASGFAGIENPLFFKTNARMVFGDAKATVSAMVAEFKSGG
jgi:NAD(P) transhydrogenase subunit beta